MRSVNLALALLATLAIISSDAEAFEAEKPKGRIHYRLDLCGGLQNPSAFHALYDDIEMEGLGPALWAYGGISLWGPSEWAGNLLSVTYMQDDFSGNLGDGGGEVGMSTQAIFPAIGGMVSLGGRADFAYVGAKVGWFWVKQSFEGKDVFDSYSGSTEAFDFFARIIFHRARGIAFGTEVGYLLADAGRLKSKYLGTEYETEAKYDFSGLHATLLVSIGESRR